MFKTSFFFRHEPLRCIIRKQWFAVVSSFKPPLMLTCCGAKCVFQSLTESILHTTVAVCNPIQDLSPGLASSDSKVEITDCGLFSESQLEILLARIPHNWSTWSWLWLFLRFKSPVHLQRFLLVRATKYDNIYWFFASRGVLSLHTKTVDGMVLPVVSEMRFTSSKVLAMHSITQLLSWRVHSSSRNKFRVHPRS